VLKATNGGWAVIAGYGGAIEARRRAVETDKSAGRDDRRRAAHARVPGRPWINDPQPITEVHALCAHVAGCDYLHLLILLIAALDWRGPCCCRSCLPLSSR